MMQGVAVMQCHLGWHFALKFNKTNYACLSSAFGLHNSYTICTRALRRILGRILGSSWQFQNQGKSCSMRTVAIVSSIPSPILSGTFDWELFCRWFLSELQKQFWTGWFFSSFKKAHSGCSLTVMVTVTDYLSAYGCSWWHQGWCLFWVPESYTDDDMLRMALSSHFSLLTFSCPSIPTYVEIFMLLPRMHPQGMMTLLLWSDATWQPILWCVHW